MSTSKKVFLPFLACSIFLLAGALSRQPTPVSSPAPFHFVAVPVENSAVADKIRGGADFLAEAIARYHPSRTPWLGMTIWQHWDDGESTYQVTGRLMQGPNQQVRLDIDANAGSAEGKFCLVSDGQRLWQVRSVGQEKPEANLLTLPGGPEPAGEALRTRTLEEYGCTGFTPLLQVLQSRLQDRQVSAGLWQGKPAVVLRGTIVPDDEALGQVPAELRSPLQPREAAVYLDADSLWPHRVEWWGSAKAGAPLTLLLQIEFRDPVLNQPFHPELCAQLFTIAD